MPTLSRWFIKLGMLYLVVGLIMSALVLIQPVLNWAPELQALRPVYLHFIFIGWVTQLIMGVGYWMFPKLTKETPRGSERLGWAVLILLNLGLVMRAIGEPAVMIAPQAGLGWTLIIASLCLVFSAWGFVLNTWGRIKER